MTSLDLLGYSTNRACWEGISLTYRNLSFSHPISLSLYTFFSKSTGASERRSNIFFHPRRYFTISVWSKMMLDKLSDKFFRDYILNLKILFIQYVISVTGSLGFGNVVNL